MQLEISVDDLKKKKLFIATPCYGGMCLGMYMKACLDLQGLCIQHGIEARFSFIFNESLITRARNYLVDEFLRSGFTHLLFIDSDIHFDPRDIVALLALDRDVIGAPYPKKSIKWPSVIQATKVNLYRRVTEALKTVESPSDVLNLDVQEFARFIDAAHPEVEVDVSMPDGTVQKQKQIKGTKEVTPGDVEMVTGDYVFNAVAGTGQFNVGEPLEVMEIGTGYMMVKREVLERWKTQYPRKSYKPDHVGQAFFDGSRYIHAFFDCEIDYKRDITIVQDYGDRKAGDVVTIGGSDRYLSEDYAFCQAWRNMGGKIWLCPWMRTFHVGTYAFQGNMPAVAQHVGAL